MASTTRIDRDLMEVIVNHGKLTVANDVDGLIADFLPDRVGQLLTSAKVPDDLVSSELLSADPGDDGSVTAVTRYTSAAGTRTELRARWVPHAGGWRVANVRNLPETAPWMVGDGPDDVELDGEHWAGLRVGELRIQRCGDCAEWTWAPLPICPRCHSLNRTWEAVEPVGTVYSWTRTWQNFSPETAGHLPYVVVLVELTHAGGRRVLGILADSDGRDVKIGTPVHGRIEIPSDSERYPLVRWHVTDPAFD